MSKLSVKTKGGSDPKGKPRVYFSCHPDDLDRYLEVLAGDIFETQNCAIYYESDPETEADLEELKRQLADMQLFVVVLTTNFLTRASRARDYEYSLAHKLHTPILPIAVEPGLESIFPEIMNQIGDGFGDIQFLDRTLQDATAIPYKEKLKVRLEATLVGDALAKRVRAAFDAYIFLSYRKKDRLLAKDLMSLIHRIPFCRDIAIWYDEFLVPGEGWSDAIAKIMAKSALVVLAVTPNLTEPENFIAEHEYPAAVKNEKEIIPAELLPTDIEALRRLFPGIPDTVDGTNADAMSAALQLELQKLALTENDEDLEHNFLIGLAYLGGIDVERNPKRALELIKGAASKGLPEAIKKLAAMYHNGDGAARNYEEEIVWLNEMLTVQKKAYEEIETAQAGKELITAARNLGDALYSLGKLDEAASAYEQMKAYCDLVYEKYPVRHIRRLLSISYEKLGDIAQAKGDLAGAEGYFLKDLKISKELAVEADTAQARRDLSIGYEKLGDITQAREDLTGAESYYLKSLKIREELAEKTDTAKAREDLIFCYVKLGDIAKAREDLAKAEDYYLKDLKISKELAEETSTVQARRNLSVSYGRLGGIAQEKEDLAKAEDYHLKALKISEELAEETGTVQARRDLYSSFFALGGIAQAKGDLAGAEDYYLKSLKISEEMAKETGTIQARRMLGFNYTSLGAIAQMKEDLSKAEGYCLKALKISKELAGTGTVWARRNLCSSYTALGLIAQAKEDLTGAEGYYLKALKISKELAEETGTVQERRDLYSSYTDLGGIAMLRGDIVGTEGYYRKALEISRELAEETGTVGSYYDLAAAYQYIGSYHYLIGDSGSGIEYLNKAVEILEKLVCETDLPQFHEQLKLTKQTLKIMSEDQ